MNLRHGLLAGSFLLVLAAAGCASTTQSTAAGGANYGARPAAASPTKAVTTTSGATLRISSFMFSALTAKPGQKIVVVNADGVQHTVNIHGTQIDVRVPGNGRASFVAPETAGSYTLTCDVHHGMQGTLIVAP